MLSQVANANNAVFVVVRNKARSTHLNEVVAKSTGNIHVLEADVVDHRALKVWTPYRVFSDGSLTVVSAL